MVSAKVTIFNYFNIYKEVRQNGKRITVIYHGILNRLENALLKFVLQNVPIVVLKFLYKTENISVKLLMYGILLYLVIITKIIKQF